MNTAQKLRAKSGPVRVLSQSDIARDYPLEASAEQLSALRDAVDADIVSRDKVAARAGNDPMLDEIRAAFLAVIDERIVSGSAALALAWVR